MTTLRDVLYGSRGAFRRAKGEPRQVRAIFSKVQTILSCNTKFLGKMAEMERLLGGEYIFDRNFLTRTTAELCALAHQVVYSLNAMSRNAYVPLYDRYQELKAALDDILADPAAATKRLITLPLSGARLERQPLVGFRAAALAELRDRLDIPAPRGFVVTSQGFALLRAANQGWWGAIRAQPQAAPSLDFPVELRRAVEDELIALRARLGREAPLWLTVEAFSRGEAGVLAEAAATPLGPLAPTADVLLAAMAGAAWRCMAGLDSVDTDTLFSAAVMALPEVRVLLEVTTQDAAAPESGLMAISARVPDKVSDPTGQRNPEEDRYQLLRVHPHTPVHTVLRAGAGPGPVPSALPDALPKASLPEALPDGRTALEAMPSRLRRGAALLTRQQLDLAARTAMAAERLLGGPQRLRLGLDAEGTLWTFGSLPYFLQNAGPDGEMGDTSEAEAETLRAALAQAHVLLEGGQTAQTGAAAGVVRHVDENDDPADFPLGAVAVTRAASPRLSGVLRRASAIITEVGTAAGHLAAIARELRVPALFGVPGALAVLVPDMEVTLDAEAHRVYRGVIPALAQAGLPGSDFDPADPEYLMLRRLLRRISPLRLVDPESPEFAPQHCRSLHDIIHFVHDRALDELLHLQERRKDLQGYHTRRLLLDVPLDIRLLDIGGGLAPQAGQTGDQARPDEVACVPLKAFLSGLTRPGVWRQAPAGLSLRDILGGMDKTYAAMTAPAFAGGNLAIVGERYLNLSLRLGYHFSVIDAHVSENPNKNAVYFRFAGGLAEPDKRARRGKLIAQVLSSMDFKVTLRGDLVVGRLKIAERSTVESVLAVLGELTAFTRQLDTDMGDDGAIGRLLERFASASVGASVVASGGASPETVDEGSAVASHGADRNPNQGG